jgi:hypothetical protein
MAAANEEWSRTFVGTNLRLRTPVNVGERFFQNCKTLITGSNPVVASNITRAI